MMREWRQCDEPWDEADRLGVGDVCRRMGWNKRRLRGELDRVASADAFLTRVARALSDFDAPRLLHRDPARGYTKIPQEAAQGEPEAVSEEFQARISDESRQNGQKAREKTNAARRGFTLAQRLVAVEKDASSRSVNIAQGLKGIERVIERLEKRVDRV